MKGHIILSTAILVTYGMYGQINDNRASAAWERTSHERWDSFRPWFYFNILNPGYKKEDRRTIYARLGTLTLMSSYADQYEMHLRSVDSTLNQETYKAMDKTFNKNWYVLQRPRAVLLYERIEDALNNAAAGDIPFRLTEAMTDRYLGIVSNIEYIKNSYSPDAEKYPLLEQEIKKLEEFAKTASLLPLLGDILNGGDLPPVELYYDFQDALQLQYEQLELLIR